MKRYYVTAFLMSIVWAIKWYAVDKWAWERAEYRRAKQSPYWAQLKEETRMRRHG